MKSIAEKSPKQVAGRTQPKPFTARVTRAAKHKIEELAELQKLPVAVVAGALVDLGACLSLSEGVAAKARASPHSRVAPTASVYLWRALQFSQRRPEQVPVLPEEYVWDGLQSTAKQVGRTVEDWLGLMLEIALPHAEDDQLLAYKIGDPVSAFYRNADSSIRADYDGTDHGAQLLKREQGPPAAFTRFEKSLKKGGGAE